MKTNFRRYASNNKIYGVEIKLKSTFCNQNDCLYSHRCKNKHKILSKILNVIYFLKKKIKLPVYIIYENLSNLSGTTSCPYSLPRRFRCEDCQYVGYDTSLNGYCTKRNNIEVIDDKGCKIGICVHQKISEFGNNYDRITGKYKNDL